jgi:uncharacterized protein (TIGR03437 family)
MQIKIAAALFLTLGMASAAISPGGIVNAASFRPQGLPNSMIAQGSIFSVFGTDLANPGVAQVSAFPLPLSLGGTSAQVTVGGTTVDCFMIFTTPGQLAILLPSGTPVGSGTLTLTVNGLQMSEAINVVASSPGIFSQNSQGSGPASLQNFFSPTDTPLNQVDQAINNG